MSIVIDEQEFRSVLCNPLSLYEAVTGWSHYKPRTPAADGDCELVVTNLIAQGCAVLCTLVHARREAFMTLLSAEDALAFRERLDEIRTRLGPVLLADALLGNRATFRF